MKTKFEKDLQSGKTNIIGGILLPVALIVGGLDQIGIINIGLSYGRHSIAQGIYFFVVAILLFVYFMIIRRNYGGLIKYLKHRKGQQNERK